VLRSFGVVASLAAAALALVIGIFAWNAHSKHERPPAMGGPSQSGIANHAATVTVRGPNGDFVVIPVTALPAPARSAPPPAARNSVATFNGGGVASGGQAFIPPAQAPRSCGGGVVGSLVGLLGGLLGGGGC
jgi:hypothetical protein